MRFLASIGLVLLSFCVVGQSASIAELRDLVEKEEFVKAKTIVDAELERGNDSAEIHALAAWTYANLIGETEVKDEKFELLDTAIDHIKISIDKEPNDAWTHFCYAVIHALKAERESSPKKKLKYVKLIKKETDIALSLDPELPEGYYLLGRWHLELSSLSWIERVGADLFLGGFPDGVSMEASFSNLNEAIDRDPECIIYNLGLAKAYIAENQPTEATATLEHTLALPNRSVHDNKRKDTARELLAQVKGL